MMRSESEETLFNPMTVVFDLDNTIISMINKTRQLSNGRLFVMPVDSWDLDQPSLNFFKANDFIIDFGSTKYLINPGVCELIQTLTSIPNIKVAFFSAGREVRNEQVVEALMLRAIGGDRYNEIKSRIVTASRELLDAEKCKNLIEIFNLQSKGKNLSEEEREDLNKIKLMNTILVDDNWVAVESQEDNLLLVPGVEKNNFEDAWLQTQMPAEEDNLFANSASDTKGTIPEKNEYHEILTEIKARRLFEKINQIFYVAGVLFSALQLVEENNLSFVEALKKIDLKDKNNKYLLNRNLFDRGLEILQRVNSDIKFFADNHFPDFVLTYSPKGALGRLGLHSSPPPEEEMEVAETIVALSTAVDEDNRTALSEILNRRF